MMKLECLDLSENEKQIMEKLNTQQKKHFREILTTWMEKMASPRV